MVVALSLVAVPATVAGADVDDRPLQVAGDAAAKLTFVGVLQVRWSDGRQDHQEILSVQAANGSVVVRGGNSVMASPQQRLVEHAGGVWDLLWPVDVVGSGRPSPDVKYQLVEAAPVVVSQRPARVVEVRHDGSLLERLALDQATGLLLRREQFEGGTRPYRTVEFESLVVDSSTPSPAMPRKVVNAVPKVVRAAKVPAGLSAPQALSDGYARVGVYRRSGVVQALYSDGLYDLSVFEQPGRLDGGKLPAGTPVTVRGRTGRHYAWPGGHVVVWEASGTVYTAVSDAPLQQVVTAVRSLPAPAPSHPFLRQLRQVCRTLIQPLAA